MRRNVINLSVLPDHGRSPAVRVSVLLFLIGIKMRMQQALMRAELAAVDGDHEVAITAYQASIDNAKKHAFINDQALATERMGLFFLNKGNLTEASNYLKQASELYETWGSIRKADHVLRKMPRLGSSDL